MGSGQLQLGIGDRMEALQALVVAKAWLTIPLCCPHLPGGAALPQSLPIATGSIPPSPEQLLLR